MTTTQIYSILEKDSEVVKLLISMDLTMVNTSNTVVSDYTAFNRAFTAAPFVLGVNAPRASALANAIATTAGISVYVRGLSDATLANGGTLAVTACVEGRLA